MINMCYFIAGFLTIMVAFVGIAILSFNVKIINSHLMKFDNR